MKSWSYGVEVEGGIWKALTVRTAASQRDKDDDAVESNTTV